MAATKTELKKILVQTGLALGAMQRLQIALWPMKRSKSGGGARVPGTSEDQVQKAIDALQLLARDVNAWIAESRDARFLNRDIKMSIRLKKRQDTGAPGAESNVQPMGQTGT